MKIIKGKISIKNIWSLYESLDLPPSTAIIWPVTQELSSVSKNLARAAESLPSPNLLRGCAFAIPSAIAVFFNIGSAILDFVKLGATQFTLMFGANSAARETVNPSTAAFAEAMIAWLVKPLWAATVENNTIEPLFFF